MTRQELIERIESNLRAGGIDNIAMSLRLVDSVKKVVDKSAEWMMSTKSFQKSSAPHIEYAVLLILFHASIQSEQKNINEFIIEADILWESLVDMGVSEKELSSYTHFISSELQTGGGI